MSCPSSNYAGLSIANWPYENWSKRVRGEVTRYFEPDSIADLSNLVVAATRERRELRVAGSMWGFEDMTYSPEWVVSIRRLDQKRVDVIPAGLSDRWRAQQSAPTGDKLFHVNAGITVGRLSELLVQQTPPLALPTLGGANGQSLIGALSTGTHGGDIELPPLVDVIVALQLMTEGGREIWVERESDGITDNAALGAALAPSCGDIEIIKNDSLFNAILVSFGRFGIVYSCVLRLKSAFRLAEWSVKRPWIAFPGLIGVEPMLRNGIASGDLFRPLLESLPPPPANLNADNVASPRGLEVTFNTLLPQDCWVRRRWPVVPGADDSDFQIEYEEEDFCRQDLASMLRTVNDAFNALLASSIVLSLVYLPSGVIGIAAVEAARMWFKNELAQVVNPTQGDLLGIALNAFFDLSLTAVPAAISGLVFGNRFRLSENGGRRGRSDLIISGYPAASENLCYRGDSIESIFDASKPGYLDYSRAIMEGLKTAKVAGWLSYRWGKPTRATLGMHNLDCAYTVSVELTSLRGLRGNAEWMRRLEVWTLANGGRPHWGQINALTRLLTVSDTREAIEVLNDHLSKGLINLLTEFPLLQNVNASAIYGDRILRWRNRLADLTGSGRTFSCAFTRTRGLEPSGSAGEPRLFGVPVGVAAGGGAGAARDLLL